MDKVTMKKIFAFHGLPQVRWLGLSRKEWEGDQKAPCRRDRNRLGISLFVKPSNLGSSVGINKATNAGELAEALDAAAALDRRIIVEGRECPRDRGLRARQRRTGGIGTGRDNRHRARVLRLRGQVHRGRYGAQRPRLATRRRCTECIVWPAPLTRR